MNLNAYDDIKVKLDKTKSWVDVKKKILYTREAIYRPYVSIVKRYDTICKRYDYFIALSLNIPDNRKYSITRKDGYGRIKIRVGNIWNDSNLKYIEHDSNISIIQVEQQEDGEVYLIDV